jgi:hypothetical protein
VSLYNFTNLTGGTFGGWWGFANSVTDNLFGNLLLLAFFMIIVISLSKNNYPIDDSILSGAFACFLIGGVMWFGGFINIIWPLGMLLLAGLIGLWKTITAPSY